MPYCAMGGHRCAQTPSSLYYVPPSSGPRTPERFRIRLCAKHGRQMLHLLYRAGADLLSENDDPEFCVKCGQPTTETLCESVVYEGEWSARFALVACGGCDPSSPDVLVEGLVGAEKLPAREKSPRGPRTR